MISWRTGLSVIQWIFNSLENWAGRKLEGKCKVMQLGWNNMQQYRLNVDRIQHSFAEKDMEVLVDQVWNTSQQCTRTEKAHHILVYISKHAASRTKEVIYSEQRKTSVPVSTPHLEFHVQL